MDTGWPHRCKNCGKVINGSYHTTENYESECLGCYCDTMIREINNKIKGIF